MRTARRIGRVAQLVGVGLLIAAVVQEAALPPEQRTGHGRVLGVVPYDLRLPTWARVRNAYWSPEDSRLFTDRVLGVGWAVNLHRVRVLLAGLFGRVDQDDARPIRLRRPDRG